jgi:hypothetical protein
MSLLAAIPAIASIAGSLFGKKTKGGETISPEQLMPDWQKQLGQQLSGWITQNMGNFTPGQAYTGQYVAGPTSQETTSLDQLTNFMNNPVLGQLFNQGKQQISDTLAGKYANPNTSPFIQSMTTMAKQNLGDLINQSRASAGARGTYYTRGAMKDEATLNERTQNQLQSVIGDFLNTERGRMFQAAPIAQSMDQYQNITAPLDQIQAGQQYGSLMRTLEQGNLEAQYQDFLRQRKEQAMPIQAAQSLYGTNAQMGIGSVTAPEVQSNNSFGNIANILGGLNWGGAAGASGGIMQILQKLLTKSA